MFYYKFTFIFNKKPTGEKPFFFYYEINYVIVLQLKSGTKDKTLTFSFCVSHPGI